MEIRARYVLVGLFVLVVIAAGLGFLYWLWGVGGFSAKTNYAVRFTGPVSGLSAGSEVLFNGITVGEVTGLSLDPKAPSDVVIAVAVDSATPIRADTKAGLSFSGLTGSARVALTGGAADAPPLAPGNPQMIPADNTTLADLTTAASGTLGEIDQLISDNAPTIHSSLNDISTFANALARNADKVDTIVNGIASLTGGSAAPMTYALHDLPAPTIAKPAMLPAGQLVVARPTALVALNTQRILANGANGDAPMFDDVRWADTLPIVVQARTIEGFQNAGVAKVVSDQGTSPGDFTLATDLRVFHVKAGGGSDNAGTADVAIGAQLLDMGGKVLASMAFTDTEPVSNVTDSQMAVAGLSAAFAKVAGELTSWSLDGMVTAEANDAAAPAPPTAPDLSAPLLPTPAPAPQAGGNP